MRLAICLLAFIASGHAFADAASDFAAAQKKIERAQAEEARQAKLREEQQAPLKLRTQTIAAAAKDPSLDAAQMEYSDGGYLRNQTRVCQYAPEFVRRHRGEETVTPESFTCYPLPALNYSEGEKKMRAIVCAVMTCAAADDFAEASGIAALAKAAQDKIDSAKKMQTDAYKSLTATNRKEADFTYEVPGYLISAQEICLMKHKRPTEWDDSNIAFACYNKPRENMSTPELYELAMKRDEAFKTKLWQAQAAEETKAKALAYAVKEGKDVSQYVYGDGYLQSKSEVCRYVPAHGREFPVEESFTCAPYP